MSALEKRLRRPLGIALFLAVFQGITGINTVLSYGSIIFKEQVGRQSDSAAIGANVIIGTINFVFLWRVLPETKGRSLEEIERAWT
jgi:ABC-type nickel/cobalt efflux system permease component RcnA